MSRDAKLIVYGRKPLPTSSDTKLCARNGIDLSPSDLRRGHTWCKDCREVYPDEYQSPLAPRVRKIPYYNYPDNDTIRRLIAAHGVRGAARVMKVSRSGLTKYIATHNLREKTAE